MSALTGPALVSAALLAVAGAQKLLDPTMTVGALRALGLAVSPFLVRIGSATEVALGVAAVTGGSSLLWWLVAASYLGFNLVVLAALRRGTMIGSCGCFGREETPPHWAHVVLNTVLAGTAAWVAVSSVDAPIEELADDTGQAAVVLLLAVLALYLLHALYVELPRALTAGRPNPIPPATDR